MRINETRGTKHTPDWQRNYYGHIIRSQDSLKKIEKHI